MLKFPTPRLDANGNQVHIGDTVLVEAEVIDFRGETLTLKAPGYGTFNYAASNTVLRSRPRLDEPPPRKFFGRKAAVA